MAYRCGRDQKHHRCQSLNFEALECRCAPASLLVELPGLGWGPLTGLASHGADDGVARHALGAPAEGVSGMLDRGPVSYDALSAVSYEGFYAVNESPGAADRVLRPQSPQRPGAFTSRFDASGANALSVAFSSFAQDRSNPPLDPMTGATDSAPPAEQDFLDQVLRARADALNEPPVGPAAAGGAPAAGGGDGGSAASGGRVAADAALGGSITAASLSSAASVAAAGFAAGQAATATHGDSDAPTPSGPTPVGATAFPVALTDATGAPIDIDPTDPNTLIVAAATWCGYCERFEDALRAPDAQQALAGLRVVFAFGDEGGPGPNGIALPSVLDDLPGEAAWFAPGSVRAETFPAAYNPATGAFDLSAFDAVDDWLARPGQVAPGAASGGPVNAASMNDSTLFADLNGDRVVNASDYVVLRDQAGASSAPGASLEADLDGSGVVDAGDLPLLFANFGNTMPPSAFSILGPLGETSDNTPEVQWEISTDAVSYDVTIASDDQCSVVVESATVTGTTFQASELVDGTYYTCVVATDDFGLITEATNSGAEFIVNTAPALTHTVFATSFQTSLTTNRVVPPIPFDFGGVEAGSWLCTLAAFNAGSIPGWNGIDVIYRAVLSDSTGNAVDTVNFQGAIFNTNGDLLASDSADFFDGQLLTPIGFDEFGNAIPASQSDFWSGNTFGGIAEPSFTCGNWDISTLDLSTGGGNATSTSWFLGNSLACVTNSAKLLCASPAQ